MRVNKIHNSPSGKVLKVLFDTGSDKTLTNKSALSKQAIPAKDKDPPNITGLHNTKHKDTLDVKLDLMFFCLDDVMCFCVLQGFQKTLKLET
jgi:hypothetical protein